MKKSYLLSVCFLLIINFSVQAQMRKTIHVFAGQQVSNNAQNNIASRPSSCAVDTILLTT